MLMLAQVVGDAALAIYLINSVSLRQAITPDHLLGRMNASMEFLVTGIGPLGLLIGGLLGSLIGIRLTLAMAAVGVMSGSLWLLFSPVASFER